MKTLLEHADLRPYFFEGKDIVKEDSQYHRVSQIADMFAIHFEHISMQKDFVPDHIWPTWQHYLRSIYATSPALRQSMREYSEILPTANQALQQEEVGRE